MPGVVDQDMEVAEGGHRLVDQALCAIPIRNVVVVGHRRPPGRGDLVDHLLRGRGVRPGAVGLAAEVVHHNLGPLGREQQRMFPSDAPAGPGDDGHPSL